MTRKWYNELRTDTPRYSGYWRKPWSDFNPYYLNYNTNTFLVLGKMTDDILEEIRE